MPASENHRYQFTPRFILLALAVCFGSAAVLFPRVKQTAFDGDESSWISSARYYTLLLASGDLQHEKWECIECDGWGSLNQQLGKWLIGLPLVLDRQSWNEGFSSYYDFTASAEENMQQGKIPPPQTLKTARRGSAVFGVLCCVVAFSIGYYACNAFVAVAAAAFVLFNQLFITCATRAMVDVHYNLFLLLFCLALTWFFSSSSRALLLSGLCGVFAGLACSVKITGLVIGGMSFLAVLTHRFWYCRWKKRAVASHLAIFCCSATVIIYGLNPYFWPSPSKVCDPLVFQEMRSICAHIIRTKQRPPHMRMQYPHTATVAGTLANLLDFPRLYLRWNDMMSLALRESPKSGWHGRKFSTLSNKLFGQFATFPGEVIFLVIGAIALGWKRLRNLCQIPECGVVLLYYLVVNYLFILVMMIVDWNRYYLPTVVASALVAAVGSYAALRLIYEYWPRRTVTLQLS